MYYISYGSYGLSAARISAARAAAASGATSGEPISRIPVQAAVDRVDGVAQVVGDGAGGGDEVLACLDLDGAIAAGGLAEPADRPASVLLDPPADCQGGEHDGEVGFDRVPGPVVDRPDLQVAFGHPEALLKGQAVLHT